MHNATTFGGVDGIFADHATSTISPHGPDAESGARDSRPALCNGAGSQRKCWYFTHEFADKFNAGHEWLINNTYVGAAATKAVLSPIPNIYVIYFTTRGQGD